MNHSPGGSGCPRTSCMGVWLHAALYFHGDVAMVREMVMVELEDVGAGAHAVRQCGIGLEAGARQPVAERRLVA
eukprot:3371033-Prymnesium_polylepis.1